MTGSSPSPSSDAILLRYGALLKQARDLIIVMDLDGYYIATSQSAKHIFGIDDNPSHKFGYRNVVVPEEMADANAIYDRLVRGEDIPTYERTFVRYDRTTFIGEVNVTLIRDKNGNPIEILSIIRDLSERKRIEAELMEKKLLDIRLQKEQELSRMRADLLMKINHEFRTPLAIINTYVSLMERHFDRLSPEKRKDYLVNVRDSVHRISGMLDDLYVIYQTQSGAPKEEEFFDFAKLVETTVTQVISEIGAEHDISLSVMNPLPLFKGYERLIWHMAHNLLFNAVQYSSPDSRIAVSLSFEGNMMVFVVQDNGIGISEKDQGHVFEPFFRGENAGNIAGSGLGLSVVQEAVRVHGGTLTLESQLGQGTTVAVILPTREA